MSPANYASKLRKLLRDGKPLDVDDVAWLETYEAKTKRGRKPAARPDISTFSPAASDPPPESPDAAGGPSADPDTLPPPIDVGGGGGSGPVPPKEAPAGNPEGPGRTETPPPPEPKAETRKSADPAVCEMLAKAYGGWLMATHAEFARQGAPALPPAVIENILVPCCYRAALHFLPNVHSVYLDAGATVVAGMGTMVMKRRLQHFGPAAQNQAAPPPRPPEPKRGKVIQMGPGPAPTPPPSNPAPAPESAQGTGGNDGPTNPYGI